MPTIASRDLRNHTARVLGEVERGAVYTVTVHGRPVAEIHRASHQRRPSVPKAELLALLDRQAMHPTADATLAADIAWISDGTTDDLDGLPRDRG